MHTYIHYQIYTYTTKIHQVLESLSITHFLPWPHYSCHHPPPPHKFTNVLTFFSTSSYPLITPLVRAPPFPNELLSAWPHLCQCLALLIDLLESDSHPHEWQSPHPAP